MPNSIERLPPPAPLIKAADHSSGHERKRQQDSDDASGERKDPDAKTPVAEDPAYLVDAHHEEQKQLDGVAAYQATAQHARQALAMRHEGARHLNDDDDAPRYAPSAPLPKAYTEHPHDDDDDVHKVNLAT